MQTLANGMMTRRFCMTSKSPLDGNRKYESWERCRVPRPCVLCKAGTMLPNSRGSKASSSMGKRISRTQEYDSGAIAPTLANNARMGHPRFFRGDIKKNRNGGPPAANSGHFNVDPKADPGATVPTTRGDMHFGEHNPFRLFGWLAHCASDGAGVCE